MINAAFVIFPEKVFVPSKVLLEIVPLKVPEKKVAVTVPELTIFAVLNEPDAVALYKVGLLIVVPLALKIPLRGFVPLIVTLVKVPPVTLVNKTG